LGLEEKNSPGSKSKEGEKIIAKKIQNLEEEATMKKSLLWALPLIGGLLIFSAIAYGQMMGRGMGPGGMMNGWGGYGGAQYPPYGNGQYQDPGGGYGAAPGMGPGRSYGMGPGMMGRGMRPGMMGPGYGNPYGPQYVPGPQYGPGSQYGPQYEQPQKPLDKKEAKQEVENYLSSTRNPNLKLGEITDKGSYFEVKIVTQKNNSLVDKILVDKNTGSMRSGY
jgi:hypothetical protein